MNNFDEPVKKAETDAEILDALQGVNLANRFVGELMEQLVQDGLLVTTKTRNGLGVRTATDAEISSPLPGQQQMTL